MSTNLRIALRFLLARKRSMIMSLAGIVFGVGLFVATQAQTGGFEDLFIRTILGTDGAIRVEDRIQDTMRTMEVEGSSLSFANHDSRKYVSGVDEPRRMRDALDVFPNVSAVSEVVRGNIRIETNSRDDSAQVFGIHLNDHLAASSLATQIVLGDLADFRDTPTGAILGRTLAARLDVRVGDAVILVAGDQRRRLRVSALFETGSTDIDKLRVYVHMSEARSLLKKPFGATFLQINVLDPDRAPQDAARMESILHHGVRSWQYREQAWLYTFLALKLSTALTVSSIIIVSGLGMFNTLAMIVLEKTREISILRSMGYTRSDISSIFLWQGVIVLAAGTVGGWIVGFAITWATSHVPIPRNGLFRSDTFPVIFEPLHYVYAGLTAFVIVMIASLIPARRAARLEPGDVIRGTAT